MEELAQKIARDLAHAANPAVVSGAGSGSVSVVRAAANVASALHKVNKTARLCMALSECNSFGCSLLAGGHAAAALKLAKRENAGPLIVLEADLYRRCDRALADALLARPGGVIVIDHTLTATAQKADIVLPAATFAEATGTLVNNEGRFQRFFGALAPKGGIAPGYRWVRDILAVARPEARGWATLDDVINDAARRIPDLAGMRAAAPDASFLEKGQRIARQSFRASGRAAVHAHESVAEQPNPADPDSALSFSHEGIQAPHEESLVAEYWSPGINSVQAAFKYKTVRRGSFVKGPGAEERYHSAAAEVFEPRQAEWLVVPMHHIFGSEELSMLSPPVAGLARPALIALNPADAAKLSIGENDVVEAAGGAVSCRCVAVIRPWVTQGSAAMSAGRPETRGVDLPQWLRVRKAEAQ